MIKPGRYAPNLACDSNTHETQIVCENEKLPVIIS